MVDFTTPNLCGASEGFNKLASQFSSIKDSLQGSLEGEIDDLKSELTASLAVLENDIKGLIPELPEIPDISLISEIQNLVSLPAGSFASLSALANIKAQFGDALDEAGFALDSLVSDATAAFSGGIDLCGGGLPNFVIGPNGMPTLKPEDSGMPDGVPVGEIISSIKTSVAEINTSNAALAADLVAAAALVKKNLPKTDVASESGNVSSAAKKEYAKQDAIIRTKLQKDGSATSPQVQKVNNAAAASSNLPPKNSLLSAEEFQLKLKGLQNRLTVMDNSIKKAAERVQFILKKSRKEEPDNILASGTEKLVRDESKSFNLSVTLPQGGATFTRNNLSFVGKQHSIGKLALGIWKAYFRASALEALKIKNEYDQEARQQEIVAQGGDPQRAAASRDTGITVTDIETSIEAIEKDGENVVAIYDELYKGIEKTYAVPV
jgi:hypothetical protein